MLPDCTSKTQPTSPLIHASLLVVPTRWDVLHEAVSAATPDAPDLATARLGAFGSLADASSLYQPCLLSPMLLLPFKARKTGPRLSPGNVMTPVAHAWDAHTGAKACHRHNAYRYLATFASVERRWTLQGKTPTPGEVAYLVRRRNWLSDMQEQKPCRPPYL